MRLSLAPSLAAALLPGLLSLAVTVHGAVPVEESVGAAGPRQSQGEPGAGASAQGAAPAGAADARRLSELFYQLQILQQELQDLRGLVEEQGHQLERLARDQKEQYIDLDGRVAALTTGTAARPAAPAGGASTGGASSPAAGGGSEREAYSRAFDLMKARDFAASADAFNQLIVDYPNGQYTPNAFYWLGELYLAQMENDKARQSFAQVINLYPDHSKVPDTLYKLGVVHHRLGDTGRALEFFEQVRSEHPESSAAGLAATYAAELR